MNFQGFVDTIKENNLEDVYYLKVVDSELTISKKHHGGDIVYKKTL